MKWDPVFYHTFEDPVWNIHLRRDGGLLIESRNQEQESVCFHVIPRSIEGAVRIPAGYVLWFSIPVYSDQDLLLLKQFDDRHNPDRTALLCYEWRSGKCLWTKNDLSFQERTRHGFSCTRPSGGEHVILDAYSGRPLLHDDPFHEKLDYSLEFPVHYEEGSEYFEQVAEYLRATGSDEPVRAIDYAERAGHIFISFYNRGPNGLILSLRVIDESGECHLAQTLGSDFQGIADPPFLFSGRNLIFVKEKRHFFVYAIATED